MSAQTGRQITGYERLENGWPTQYTSAQQAQGFAEGLVPVGGERFEEGLRGGGQFGAVGGACGNASRTNGARSRS
jgi:hypothetical protein